MNDKTNKTILVIVVGLLCLSYIFTSEVLVIISTSIGLLSLIHPKIGKFFEFLWMKLAKILGWINSRILLTLIFFIILYPISLLSKIFTKTSQVKLRKSTDSYYLDRQHLFSSEDMENVW